MGRKRDRTGIAGFFDDLEQAESKTDQVADAPTKTERAEKSHPLVKERPANPQKNESNQKQTKSDHQRTHTPTGRPRGRQEGEGPLKTRTTLWLPEELMETYRERVWIDRCHLGELVERALRDYRDRNWGKKV